MAIEHLFDYHPWRDGKNPEHKGPSVELLKFKKGDAAAVNYFYRALITRLNRDVSKTQRFKVATVPSSTAGKANPGFTALIHKLKTYYPNIANNGNQLKRYKSIETLHKGGDRGIGNHLDSIRAVDSLGSCDDVVLLDDVTTTGNSLIAAKQILERSDCNVILTIALCKTVDNR